MDERRHAADFSDDPRSANAPKSGVASNAGAAVIVLLMIGGIWWWAGGGEWPGGHRAANNVEAVSTDESISHASGNGNGTDDSKSESHAPAGNGHKTPATSDNAAEIDPERANWLDPFQKRYWKSADWKFDETGMQSTDAESALAAFRRQFSKVTVECDVTAIDEPGAFQIQLLEPTTGTRLQAEFTTKGVVVSSRIKNEEEKVIKQREFAVPLGADDPTAIHFTATGNRVIVVCDNKVVLTCSQPAEQSGKSLQLSLCSEGGRFRVSRLRLDGE